MSKTKRVYVLSQYGVWSREHQKRRSGLVGVYTQKHQLYKAMLVLCGFEGNLNEYDKQGLPMAFMGDGKEANYSRICRAISKGERRVRIFDHDEEPYYNVWECPLNLIPNLFRREGEEESEAWWEQNRFKHEPYDDDEEYEDDEYEDD